MGDKEDEGCPMLVLVCEGELVLTSAVAGGCYLRSKFAVVTVVAAVAVKEDVKGNQSRF